MSQAGRKPFATVSEARAGQKIKAGGAGTVYYDSQRSDMVLKILKPPHRTPEMEAKLHAMLSHPPMNQTFSHRQRTLVQIAWPQEIVVGARGEFVGFTMRLLDLSFANELFCWMDPGERRYLKLSPDDRLRVNLAANLATTLGYLHSVGHAFVDLKGLNVMAYRDLGYVCLIDCDGFRIADQGRVFPADLYTENYLAPEYQTAARARTLNKADVGEEQDRFALAVLVFELLDNATHPFSGRDLRHASAAPTIADLILQKRSFLDPAAGLAAPSTSHFRFFHDDTLQLLSRSLLGAPDQRPSAQDWRTHLKDVARNMQQCTVKPHHWGYGKGCPWCSSVAPSVRHTISVHSQVPPPPPLSQQAGPLPPSSANTNWPSGSQVTLRRPARARARPRRPSRKAPFALSLQLPQFVRIGAATIVRTIAAISGTMARKRYLPAATVALVLLLVTLGASIPWASVCLRPGGCESPSAPQPDLRTGIVAASNRLQALTTEVGSYPPAGWDAPHRTAQEELSRMLGGQQSDPETRESLMRTTSAIDQLDALWRAENADRQAIESRIQAAADRLRAQVTQGPTPRPNGWTQAQSGAERSLGNARSSIAEGAKSDAGQYLSRAIADIDRLGRLADDAAAERTRDKDDLAKRLDDTLGQKEPPPSLPLPTDPQFTEATRRLDDLQIRAHVIVARLDSLRERQRRLNLDLRADMATAELRMRASLRAAEEAINQGQMASALSALDTAQTAIEQLARFLNI